MVGLYVLPLGYTNKQKAIIMKTWIYTLISEKGLNLETIIEVDGEMYGANFIPLGVVVEHILIANPQEQKWIKDTLVKIDFANGDIMHLFKHLAQALAI